MRIRRIAALLCVLVLLIAAAAPAAGAAQEDTVYVRKHVSLLYDNSGSMSMELDQAENLKWCYGSYAAQAFTALLNDMDTLTLTFMNAKEQGQVQDSRTSYLELDMAGDRQAQVTQVLEATSWASGGTPVTSIDDALQVLIDQGLRSDEELSGGEVNEAEQYWLVLTTDGVFDTSAPGISGKNLPSDAVEDVLAEILEQYSSLQLVYFGIGTENDSSKFKAVDFASSSRLAAYSNFTAVYAEKQEEIVSTMQQLANRISGRYGVSKGIEVSGNTVTLDVSGESSPIRNIAVLAQQTNAKLVSAKMKDGTPLQIARSARLEYPENDDYDELPQHTLGGLGAMVSCEDGKIPIGKVVLTFSENVSQKDLSLMYEPAISVALTVQRQTSSGEWEEVPYNGKLVAGDTLRVQYTICEDGSDEPLDPDRLPGKTEAQITRDGESLTLGEAFTMQAGSSILSATISMMDGAYCVSTSRTLKGIKFTDFAVVSSGPLTLGVGDLKENTQQRMTFTVSSDGVPATKEQLAAFALDMGGLDGAVEIPENGVFRYTPRDEDGKAGIYTVTLSCDGKVMAEETVTVEPNPTTYTAEAGEPLAVYDKDLRSNESGLVFYVTAHNDEGDSPLRAEEAVGFSAEAKTVGGDTLNGRLEYGQGGELHFIPSGDGAAVGDYTVTLLYGEDALAAGKVSVMRYNAAYTVEAVLPANVEVDRFNLLRNETAVTFLIYGDGVPCTAEQLEAMLGTMILTSKAPDSSLMKLDVSLTEYNGMAAVSVRPASSSDNWLGAFFQKTLIAWGGVQKGDLTVTLTVDGVKGDSASGVLQVVSSAFDDIFYKLLFLVLACIAGLIGAFVISNMKMTRIKPGMLYYYELAPRGNNSYYLRRDSMAEVPRGLQMRLWPHPQKMNFEELTFIADTGKSRRWGKKNLPYVWLHDTHRALLSYYQADETVARAKLLEVLASGGKSATVMRKVNVESQMPKTAVVRGKDPAEGEKYSVYPPMEEGGFLVRKIGDGTLKLWVFKPHKNDKKL